MIGLQFTGKCKDCEYADLELIDYATSDGGKYWMVRCIHEAACCRMQNKADEAEGEE